MIDVLLLGGQGFIGSALASHLRSAGRVVRTIDIGRRGVPLPDVNDAVHFQDLFRENLANAGTIIHVAGASSVADCDSDPAGSFDTNANGFAQLLANLSGQRFIYASSMRVYGSGEERREGDPLPRPTTLYDACMVAREHLAAIRYPTAYGLRLGVVAGPSPNTRRDTALNAMVASATDRGFVGVANPDAMLPVVGIGDLCRVVDAILAGAVPPGPLNVASFNRRVGEIAGDVADWFGVPLRPLDKPPAPSLSISTARLAGCGWRPSDTVPGIIRDLEAHYRATRRDAAA